MGLPFGTRAGRKTGVTMFKPHSRWLDQENRRQPASPMMPCSKALLTGTTWKLRSLHIAFVLCFLSPIYVSLVLVQRRQANSTILPALTYPAAFQLSAISSTKDFVDLQNENISKNALKVSEVLEGFKYSSIQYKTLT